MSKWWNKSVTRSNLLWLFIGFIIGSFILAAVDAHADPLPTHYSVDTVIQHYLVNSYNPQGASIGFHEYTDTLIISSKQYEIREVDDE